MTTIQWDLVLIIMLSAMGLAILVICFGALNEYRINRMFDKANGTAKRFKYVCKCGHDEAIHTGADVALNGELKKEIRARFPGCFITKLDSSEYPGIPDLLILWGDQWAILEVKRSATATYQPNQEYYIDQFNMMSFSSVIFPENKEAVLDALQQSFGAHRAACYR